MLIAFILCLSSNGFRQGSDFKNFEKKTVQGSGGQTLGILSLGDLNAFSIGGQGMFHLNPRWAIGAYGGGLVSHSEILHKAIDQAATKIQIGCGYGGIVTRYTLNAESSTQVSIPFQLGLGGIGVDDENDKIIESSRFYLMGLGAEVSVHLGEHFAPTLGLSYLHSIIDKDLKSIEQDALSGLSLTLRFDFY